MSQVLARAPWMFLDRARLRFDILARSISQSKHHLNAAFQLDNDTPAMEALKRIPYPTAALDPSVFEEVSEENTAIERHSPARHLPKTSIQTLIDLLERKRYTAAERVCRELLQMGVEIPLNPIYEKAAIAVLRDPNRENRAETFARWFSLIPMAHESKPRSFNTICNLLFYKSLIADIPLIQRFGLVCASKGYARKIASQVLPYVIRFTDPSVSSRFLDEFESLSAQNLRKIYPTKVKKMLKSFRGSAIISHCRAGRPEEAIKIFQASRACNLRMSRFTCAFLLRALEQNLDPANIRIITELRRRPYYSRSDHADELATTTWSELSQLASLALNIKILRRSLVSHRPPIAPALCKVMAEYRATGRSRALTLLRKKAFQHSHESIRLWLVAEMLYHAGRTEPAMVVVTFAKHFHLVGVPHDLILLQLQRSLKIRKIRSEQFRNLVPRHYPMKEKILPSSMATTLLWQALATLSNGTGELENVYRQLLGFARLGKESASSLMTSPPPLPVPPQAIRQTHFYAFLRLFIRRSGPNRALSVLSDMLSLGIEPNHHHYVMLSIAFARAGNVETAMALLDPSEHADRRTESPDPLRPLSLPAIATYTKLLRSFIGAERYDAALEIDNRILTKLYYFPGTNFFTAHARTVLQNRLRQQVIPSSILTHKGLMFFLAPFSEWQARVGKNKCRCTATELRRKCAADLGEVNPVRLDGRCPSA